VTQPFEITASIQQALQAIDQGSEQIASLIISSLQAERQRLRARVRAAHFTAWLDGYGLSADEAAEVLINGRKLPGREGKILQLKRAYQALEQIEAWTEANSPLDEKNLCRLHAILAGGRKARPSQYRPDPAIPGRIDSMLSWLSQEQPPDLTAPLLAGMAQFEINAIQPFTDFNARLGRMLADWVLERRGYPLLRTAALEEAFAADLPSYQAAAALNEATPWLEYFTARLAAAYAEAALQASQLAGQLAGEVREMDETGASLPRPDARARRVLRLFATQAEISVKDVRRILGVPPKAAGELLESWLQQGWLVKAGARYRMSGGLKTNFQQFIGQDY